MTIINKNKKTPEEGEVKAPQNQNNKEEKKEQTLEEKLKETEEKLLRSLAEVENQKEDLKKKLKMLLNLDHLILQKRVLLSLIIYKEQKMQLRMTKN